MEVTADHLPTGLKQIFHNLHKSIYIVEIMKDPSLHEHCVKEPRILSHIDLHNVTYFISDLSHANRKYPHMCPVLVVTAIIIYM